MRPVRDLWGHAGGAGARSGGAGPSGGDLGGLGGGELSPARPCAQALAPSTPQLEVCQPGLTTHGLNGGGTRQGPQVAVGDPGELRAG